jgi:hypothetical protein
MSQDQFDTTSSEEVTQLRAFGMYAEILQTYKEDNENCDLQLM